MQVKVTRLWENGKLVPKWRLSQIIKVDGNLSLRESRDEHLNRSQRSAYLHFDGLQVAPTLIDACVLWIRGDLMTISGFERDELSNVTYAQTWLIEIINSTQGN